MPKLILIIGSLLLVSTLSHAQNSNSFEIYGQIISENTSCKLGVTDIIIPNTPPEKLKNIHDTSDWGYGDIRFTECTIGILGGVKQSSVALDIPLGIPTEPSGNYWSSNSDNLNFLGFEVLIDETRIGTFGRQIGPKEIENGAVTFATKSRIVRIAEGDINATETVTANLFFSATYQ